MLEDRINRVINTAAFERSLKSDGLEVFDFQADWCRSITFDNLPEAFQKAEKLNGLRGDACGAAELFARDMLSALRAPGLPYFHKNEVL